MTAEDINRKLIEIINEYTGLEPEEINDELSIQGDLALNSFQLIALTGSMEDTFNIKVEENDMMGFEVLGDVKKYLYSKVL